jgi:release factor glutamine methyltransferase
MIPGQTLDRNLIRCVEWAEKILVSSDVPNPRYDAEILLASVLELERIDLFLHPRPLKDADQQLFQDRVRRRSRREPLQYILGEAPFYGRSFLVNTDVLIPRPETESLIEECLKRAHRPSWILDVGTGSGCIAVTLACELPEARIIAVDSKVEALSVAKRNAVLHHVSDRIQWVCGDLCSHLDKKSRADLVVANLPYIPELDLHSLQAEVRDHEPMAALHGGKDGLSLIRALTADVPGIMKPGGLLALEFGSGQEEAVRTLIQKTGSFGDVDIVKDLAGRNRMAFASMARKDGLVETVKQTAK